MSESRYSFQGASDIYDKSRHVPDEVLARLAEALAESGHDPWLDVGVGTGRTAIPLARTGARVVGVDLAPSMMERLRARADAPVHLVRGDFTRMPFRRGGFGAAVAYHVLHLVPQPTDLLLSIQSVVEPGAPLFWLSDMPKGRGIYQRMKARYGELIAGRHPFGKPSSRDFAFIEQALASLGWTFAELPVADLVWERSWDREELLDLFARKGFSILFHVPDDLHAELVDELRDWAGRELPERETLEFRIRVVKVEIGGAA